MARVAITAQRPTPGFACCALERAESPRHPNKPAARPSNAPGRELLNLEPGGRGTGHLFLIAGAEASADLTKKLLTTCASASTNSGRALKDRVLRMRIPFSAPNFWASTSRS